MNVPQYGISILGLLVGSKSSVYEGKTYFKIGVRIPHGEDAYGEPEERTIDLSVSDYSPQVGEFVSKNKGKQVKIFCFVREYAGKYSLRLDPSRLVSIEESRPAHVKKVS